jgi:hypothetical protein
LQNCIPRQGSVSSAAGRAARQATGCSIAVPSTSPYTEPQAALLPASAADDSLLGQRSLPAHSSMKQQAQARQAIEQLYDINLLLRQANNALDDALSRQSTLNLDRPACKTKAPPSNLANEPKVARTAGNPSLLAECHNAALPVHGRIKAQQAAGSSHVGHHGCQHVAIAHRLVSGPQQQLRHRASFWAHQPASTGCGLGVCSATLCIPGNGNCGGIVSPSALRRCPGSGTQYFASIGPCRRRPPGPLRCSSVAPDYMSRSIPSCAPLMPRAGKMHLMYDGHATACGHSQISAKACQARTAPCKHLCTGHPVGDVAKYGIAPHRKQPYFEHALPSSMPSAHGPQLSSGFNDDHIGFGSPHSRLTAARAADLLHTHAVCARMRRKATEAIDTLRAMGTTL